MYLVLDHLNIIVGDPLVAVVGIRAYPALGILGDLPALIDLGTYLIVSKETCLLGELAFVALVTRGVKSGVGWIVQSECLTVQRHAHDQLVSGCPLLNPVVHGEVLQGRK